MPFRSEFEEYGKRLGASVASDCRRQVLRAGSTSELGRMAGEKLEGVRGSVDAFIHGQRRFREGFWEGFMERAELIRLEDR